MNLEGCVNALPCSQGRDSGTRDEECTGVGSGYAASCTGCRRGAARGHTSASTRGSARSLPELGCLARLGNARLDRLPVQVLPPHGDLGQGEVQGGASCKGPGIAQQRTACAAAEPLGAQGARSVSARRQCSGTICCCCPPSVQRGRCPPCPRPPASPPRASQRPRSPGAQHGGGGGEAVACRVALACLAVRQPHAEASGTNKRSGGPAKAVAHRVYHRGSVEGGLQPVQRTSQAMATLSTTSDISAPTAAATAVLPVPAQVGAKGVGCSKAQDTWRQRRRRRQVQAGSVSEACLACTMRLRDGRSRTAGERPSSCAARDGGLPVAHVQASGGPVLSEQAG